MKLVLATVGADIAKLISLPRTIHRASPAKPKVDKLAVSFGSSARWLFYQFILHGWEPSGPVNLFRNGVALQSDCIIFADLLKPPIHEPACLLQSPPGRSIGPFQFHALPRALLGLPLALRGVLGV